MDGKGRATDNAFIESFWKTIKYEKIYACPSEDGVQLFESVKEYIEYYNYKREHSSIGDKTPNELYSKQLKVAA